MTKPTTANSHTDTDSTAPSAAKNRLKGSKQRKAMRLLLWICAAAILTLTLVLGAFQSINTYMLRQSQPYITANAQDVRPMTVGVVPGARIYKSGRLSAYLEDRVDRAIELYNAGKIKKIIMSGDNRSRYYDEATAMRNYAVEHGVPEDDVLRDFAGLRTLDTVWRVRDIWEQTEFVIITQDFHLPRAVYLARTLGIDAQGFVADNRKYLASVENRLAQREWFARVGAWLDLYVLGTRPRHLGETQKLSGIAQEAEVREQQRNVWKEELRLSPTPTPTPRQASKTQK